MVARDQDDFEYRFAGAKQVAALTQKQMRYAGYGSSGHDTYYKTRAYTTLKLIEEDSRDKIKEARAELRAAKRAKDIGRAREIEKQIKDLTKTMKDAKKHARMAQKYTAHGWGRKLYKTTGSMGR